MPALGFPLGSPLGGTASTRGVFRLLLSFLPPGSERWMALDPDKGDAMGGLFLALAGAFKQYGTDVLDMLRTELDWNQMSARLPDWEAILSLAQSRAALYGTMAARRAQVISRRREFGLSTPANIQNALAPVAGYSPTVIEASRAAVRAANTYPIGGGAIPNPGTLALTATAADNAPASAMGAQVTLRVNHATPGDLTFRLTGPDGTIKTWPVNALGTAALSGGIDNILYGKEFAGKQITGAWTFEIINAGATAGSIVVVAANGVFVEGVGRAVNGADGRAAAMFEWNSSIDPALVNADTYSLASATTIVTRWNPAHAIGFAVTKMSGGAAVAIYDDTNAIENNCIYGT